MRVCYVGKSNNKEKYKYKKYKVHRLENKSNDCNIDIENALESGQEARMVQIDFGAAFDRVNHRDILYKLCSVGIGGSVLSILTTQYSFYQTTYEFLSIRSQHVLVDGCRSKLVTLSQECRRAVFWPLCCSSCTLLSFFTFWKISCWVMLMTTLMAVVPSPGVRVTVAESLIRDLGWVSEWCDLLGMKFNASKTKTMIVSRSRTSHPQSLPLTIG